VLLDFAAVGNAGTFDPLEELLNLIATTPTTELFGNFFASVRPARKRGGLHDTTAGWAWFM